MNNNKVYLVCGTSKIGEDFFSLRKAFDSKEKAEAEFNRQAEELSKLVPDEDMDEAIWEEDGAKYLWFTCPLDSGRVFEFSLDMREVGVL